MGNRIRVRNPTKTLTQPEVFDKILSEGNLTVIAGRRGSGKTGFGFSVLEYAHKQKRPVYIIGFPDKMDDLLPSYVISVSSLSDVPNGSFALLDEAILQYNARQWNTNLSDLSLVVVADLARHKNLSIIFVSVNLAMIDINAVRTINTLILKEPSLLQEHTERAFMKKFLKVVASVFNSIPHKDRPAYSYIFDDRLEGLVKTELPAFWSEELSRSWKDYASKDKVEIRESTYRIFRPRSGK